MALAFAIATNGRASGFTFMAVGTDGQDGPTPVAGVIVNGDEPFNEEEVVAGKNALKRHDSYNFWYKYRPNGLVQTGGPTGVNVMDIYCLIKVNKSGLKL